MKDAKEAREVVNQVENQANAGGDISDVGSGFSRISMSSIGGGELERQRALEIQKQAEEIIALQAQLKLAHQAQQQAAIATAQANANNLQLQQQLQQTQGQILQHAQQIQGVQQQKQAADNVAQHAQNQVGILQVRLAAEVKVRADRARQDAEALRHQQEAAAAAAREAHRKAVEDAVAAVAREEVAWQGRRTEAGHTSDQTRRCFRWTCESKSYFSA